MIHLGRRIILVLCYSLFLSACTDNISGTLDNVEPSAGETHLESLADELSKGGPIGNFPIVIVRPDAPPQARGALANNLADAVLRVAPGGVIKVHGGTYSSQDLIIDKPLTLEGTGDEMPRLNGGGAFSSLTVTNMPAGTVIIRRLHFENAMMSIHIENAFDRVIVEDNRFDILHGEPNEEGLAYNSGIFVWASTGNDVLIRNNIFNGGDIGVHTNFDLIERENAGVRVLNNRFVGQSNASVHGPVDLVQNNVIEDCSIHWCMFVASQTDNAFDMIISGNQIRTGGTVHNAIVVIGPGSATVTSNTIIATNPDGTAAEPDINFPGSAIDLSHLSSVDASNNTIRNTVTGITFGSGVAQGFGSNNDIRNVDTGIIVFWDVSVEFRRNDLSDYVTSAHVFSPTSGEVDLSCDWWGPVQDGAPVNTNVPDEILSAFVPWSTQPIANRPDVACP